LRWIFCGGKGGVGKTTTSCSLAVQLAKVRESVLLISTDPAHNLSDAFGQKFGKDARKVNGFDNLSAMEIDPTSSIREMIEQSTPPLSFTPKHTVPSSVIVFFFILRVLTFLDDANNPMSGMMQDLAFSIPGVDEAMNFAEVMKQVNSMEYSVIIFDTAPTGHTLRFLSFPTVLEKALAKVSQLSSRFGPMMNQMSSLLGVQAGGTDELFSKLEGMRETVKLVNQQFQYVP
jgi:arsenite-transporting ATPase